MHVFCRGLLHQGLSASCGNLALCEGLCLPAYSLDISFPSLETTNSVPSQGGNIGNPQNGCGPYDGSDLMVGEMIGVATRG